MTKDNAMDYIELLQQDAEEDRTDIHFSEDNLVKWLTEFSDQQCAEKDKRIAELEKVLKELVELKDIKTREESGATSIQESNRLMRQYETRKQIAWEQACSLLSS